MSAIEDNAYLPGLLNSEGMKIIMPAQTSTVYMKFANIPVQIIYMHEHQVRNTWQFIFVDVKKKKKKEFILKKYAV